MHKSVILFITLFSLVFSACKKELEGASYDPEGSTNTKSKSIDYQVRRTWRTADISVSNEFTGARLNGFEKVSDSLYKAIINPENGPINKSPWYAFRIWSKEPRSIAVELTYFEEYSHRYYPDLSYDMKNWLPIDSSRIFQDTVSNTATLLLDVGPKPLYVSAQEIMTSEYVYHFTSNLDTADFISSEVIGYSNLGKEIPLLKIGHVNSENILVILGRQHPPEATGFLALQSFVRRLTGSDSLAERFRENHLILLIPMLNPDGVDQGHWRHNAGGVDLNRDWQYFNQPETAAVKNYIQNLMNDSNRKILFEIDFHSTQEDLFYVFKPDQPSNLTGFTHQWLDRIEAELPWYVADRIPTSGDSPVSTYWFYSNYNTEAVTYEVGDDSPRAVIDEIGQVAAESMMELLLERESN